MIKKLSQVLVLVLAANFVAVAGAVGWLLASGKIDGTKLAAIREMIAPTPVSPEVLATQPTTQPATQPATSKLDELLAKYSGRPASEQVELAQRSIDAQSAALDRRARDLDNLMAQVLREKEELARKSGAVDSERKQMADDVEKQAALADDKGFQESLKLYTSMPAKQAKAAFLSMTDELVARYLQAMPQRAANRVVKEFKSPEEQARINRVLDRVRQGNAPTTRPAATAARADQEGRSSPTSAEPASGRAGSAPP